MTQTIPTLPLVSGGERETIETRAVSGVGGHVADVALARRVHARDALEAAREEGFDDLADVPVLHLLDRLADAGRRFDGVGPGGGSSGGESSGGGSDDAALAPLDEYAERVARTTGLPVGWVQTSAHWLTYGLRHAAETLRAQSPTGDLGVYDDAAYTRERTVGLAFAPGCCVLGAVMPANGPAVYAWPALALAMKVPVVLRPSRRDPFTAVRLGRALLAAGIPPSAVHVLPGPRELGDVLAREADHALVFGDDAATDPYRDDPAVETYGPGRSVAVVGRDPTERELDSLARGIARAGGRTCFNLSRIVALDDCDADALANRLAGRLADDGDGTPADGPPTDDPSTDGSPGLPPADGPPTDEATDVPAFPDPERARRIDDRATSAGEDLTAERRDGPRLTAYDDHARLAPTVVRTDDLVPELPFQFAGVTARDPEDPGALFEELGSAYLGVVVGSDPYEAAMARSPRVRKVYGGTYPAAVDLRETHETYLADFLYETTTYDPS